MESSVTKLPPFLASPSDATNFSRDAALTSQVSISRRSTQAEEFQQKGDGDFERVLLQPPGQPLPQRGGQGRACQEVQHHGVTGQRLHP